MSNRNELERLLAAATEGPFSGIYKNYAVHGNMRAIVNGDRYPIAFVPAWDAPEDGEVEASAEGEANAALICFLRNNAQHYLSLMDEVERLSDFAQMVLSLGDQFMQPDTIRQMARQALGETHDN